MFVETPNPTLVTNNSRRFTPSPTASSPAFRPSVGQYHDISYHSAEVTNRLVVVVLRRRRVDFGAVQMSRAAVRPAKRGFSTRVQSIPVRFKFISITRCKIDGVLTHNTVV